MRVCVCACVLGDSAVFWGLLDAWGLEHPAEGGEGVWAVEACTAAPTPPQVSPPPPLQPGTVELEGTVVPEGGAAALAFLAQGVGSGNGTMPGRA